MPIRAFRVPSRSSLISDVFFDLDARQVAVRCKDEIRSANH